MTNQTTDASREYDPYEIHIGIDDKSYVRADLYEKLLRTYEATKQPMPLSEAPCSKCGYNGPGYYQPSTHQCAATSIKPATVSEDVIEREAKRLFDENKDSQAAPWEQQWVKTKQLWRGQAEQALASIKP